MSARLSNVAVGTLAAAVLVTACKSTITGREPVDSVQQLTAQSGFGRAFVSWSPAARASRYRLLVSTNEAFAASSDPEFAFRDVSSTATFQEVAGLSAARTHWFAVIAVVGSDGALAPTRAVAAHVPGPDESMGAPRWRLVGSELGGELGYAVSAAGDVNGDGYDDVLVGAPDDPAGGGPTGRYRVYPGGPAVTRTNEEAFLMSDDQRGSRTRYATTLGRAGDVNADGFDDFLVGAPFDTTVLTHDGTFWIVYGEPITDVPNDDLFTDLVGATDDDRLGASFAALGSSAGFAVGKPAPLGTSRPGEVWVYRTPALTPTVLISTTNASSFGASIAALKDGGGRALAVGEPGFDGPIAESGRVVLRTGADFGTETIIGQGTALNERFGTQVASAGDVNADGAEDLLVLAAGFDPTPGNETPTAHLLLGPAPFTDRRIFHKGTAGTLTVAGAGDVDADGYDDVLVGQPEWQGQTGRALLYRGGPDGLALAPAWIREGDGPLDRFGGAVAGAGDVDADGFPDLVIGAPRAAGFGRVELFRGHRGVGLDVNAGLPRRTTVNADILLLHTVFSDPLGAGPYASTVDWGDGEPVTRYEDGVDCFDESPADCQVHRYGSPGRWQVRLRIEAPDGRFGEALTTIEVGE